MGCCNLPESGSDQFSTDGQRNINQLSSKTSRKKLTFTQDEMESFLETMKEQNLSIDVPIKKKSDTAKIFLIRHGVSMHNYNSWKIQKEFGKGPSEQMDSLEMDMNMIDPVLHPLGAF